MSRITKLYKPAELSEIISLMQNSYDSSLDPFQRMSRLVKALHDAGWKIERMQKEKIRGEGSNFPSKFVKAVVSGEVPGFTADKNNPALQYTPMDISAKPGTKVRFTGYGGYDTQQANARKYIHVGDILTVKRIEVGGWSSSVCFDEWPHNQFNTVMFEEVQDAD